MILGIENDVHRPVSVENHDLLVFSQGIPSALRDPHVIRPDGLHQEQSIDVSDGIVRIRTSRSL